uniref:NADH dehydrogenase subunit 6 n=1 Tax=Amblyomma hebraeum TaxID=34608 RepID=UPI0022382767|nr:NADH dehydrogenase subunit 6 [Amblyomma hebraeum]QLD96944.1 NADH dehydrogenase subunit 6 [Amblyomma hebraeum]QLD96957.1 NADH dehydrogenase subunit 6 [Amblyomma hebraeum]UYB77935.1 NADH dehydrogenase subunit 6 [Amblyomma hebraeum]
MKMLAFISILLMTMSHPVSMLFSIIMLTLLVSLTFYKISTNSLLPLILILLILGGMLVIFLYMVSLCPNKKINFKIKNFSLTFSFFFFSFYLTFNKVAYLDLMKIYYFPFFNMLLLMMIYLLISLLVVMKMLNWISSPMKSLT